MTRILQPSGAKSRPRTWDQFKSEVRKADRDSLLLQAATMTARIARGGVSDLEAQWGLTPWAIADVARTSLAWGSFARPEADLDALIRLCNLNVHIGDEGLIANDDTNEVLNRVLMRLFFEQFPGQRSILADVPRSLLLFGAGAEYPDDFAPKAMTPGWFELATGGLKLEEYVEAVFLIDVITQENNGQFSPDLLNTARYRRLEEVISFDAVRRVFIDYLSTTVREFKLVNRTHQDAVSTAQKKFTFNPLADRPFITDVSEIPLAPWVQAILAKALPPAIYHLSLSKLGEAFTKDLGSIFQHYTGRQLALIEGDKQVLPEIAYGPRRTRVDSCDWFLDLPGVLVLIECKARQPIESLRTGGAAWLDSVEGSINRGISQLNRSNRDISEISAVCPLVDSSKPRVGLVVTLEPFYVGQNWLIADHLEKSDIPVGVVSIAELESLVLLTADELTQTLLDESTTTGRLMQLKPDPVALSERVNPLLESTWESIGLFSRARAMAGRISSE